jgi:small subunit ribosomal protein S14
MKQNGRKKWLKRSREMVCRKCGTETAVIRKYGLMLCRRCFKEEAEKIGFKKFD